MSDSNQSVQTVDAVIVGAGFTGLYALYRLRELGFSVQGIEAATGVGGTWYWNRYPGARTDSPSYVYQFWFSEEILNEWDWSERYPAQQETERYLNFVADKLALRKDYQFSTRVTAADFNEETERWLVTLDNGNQLDAQYMVMGTGGLTEPVFPDIEGVHDFGGEYFHTARWPEEEPDFSNKRVGIIGTGATGIQVIQTIAPNTKDLTVFQRTPNYTIPMRNPKWDDKIREAYRAKYPEIRETIKSTFAGFDFDFSARPYDDFTPQERLEKMEEWWADGSFAIWVGSFAEVFADEEANNVFSKFAQEKIRARINDPKVAEKLVPTEYGFGTRRVPLETNYYEAYNQDNVHLIDTNDTPIERITAEGVVTSDGLVELDVLILATGFEVGTGALTRIDIRGRGGKLLKDTWDEEVRTFLGMQVHGYPNMFMAMAPMSPSAAYCNVPTCSQQQVEWITDCIAYIRDQDRLSIEPTLEAQDGWVAHHDEISDGTLARKTRSWHVTHNANGKPRTLAYAGGQNNYRARCEEIKAGGYSEFAIA
ncbi:MAG: NAD(P)/FAD-dependent oxidoreductase [Pseudomonadota bacterium]